ncbi:helix-turn-helix domain-containing protein [Streptantibioticus ferralitis]|uniref:Helix-turn-helix transcriptional regulator n=1 Tax=Streptantibioticus ferralitis TaxID=236510 RepID=A0ABT5Z694_9ACTN|nr:helix-turn-helix transcriptional regulator [Streptantibioticus ferralitis]MDF2259323.1 helix-turn-helix transcriptional regulator [Streptantibioticus ferralitis]
MPMRSRPTGRQLRLGAELRKLRERAGLSSTKAGHLLGTNQAQISNIEASRIPVSAARVRALARNYTCSDEKLIDALVGMTGPRARGWWEEYRELLPTDLLDLAELEHYATALRVAVVIHIPGLLQTTDHARASLRETVPPLRQYELEHRLSYRMKRQAVLYGDKPTPYTAIVHEAALRMGFGGAAVARQQLMYLLEMSEQENITLLVIPFGEAPFASSGQSITYAEGPVPGLDTVELDTEHGCEFLDAEAQLTRYRSVLDQLTNRTLKPQDSRDLINRIAHEN